MRMPEELIQITKAVLIRLIPLTNHVKIWAAAVFYQQQPSFNLYYITFIAYNITVGFVYMLRIATKHFNLPLGVDERGSPTFTTVAGIATVVKLNIVFNFSTLYFPNRYLKHT